MTDAADVESATASALRRLLEVGDAEPIGELCDGSVSWVAHLAGQVISVDGRGRVVEALAAGHRGGASAIGLQSRWFPEEDGRAGGDISVTWEDAEGQAMAWRHFVHLNASGSVVRLRSFTARPARSTAPRGDAGPILAALRDTAKTSDPLAGGYSGAFLERLTFDAAPPQIVKYLTPEEDWHGTATGQLAREAVLFERGALDALPSGVGHAISAVEHFGDGWVVVSRDVTSGLQEMPVDDETLRRHLTALDVLHTSPATASGLATVGQRWRLWWPEALAEQSAEVDEQPKRISRGWDVLAQVAAPDITDVCRGIAASPDRLLAALAGYPQTLLHGDGHLANAAVIDGQVVLLDWGLATLGPAAVEAAWLANFPQQYRCSVDDMLSMLRGVWNGLDGTSLKLALLGQGSSIVPALASDAIDYPGAAHRHQTQNKLTWWTDTMRECSASVAALI